MKTKVKIRKYEKNDVDNVVRMIRRNLREVNAKDYPGKINGLVRFYNKTYIEDVALSSNVYVAEEHGKIIGMASIASWGMESSRIRALFVCPDCHGKGIGKMLMDKIKKDRINERTKKITVTASITARYFYEKMGFRYNERRKFDGMFYNMYMENNNSI